MKKLKQLALIIEQGNAEFKAMSKAEKRVQIAKDCILRIESKQLIANTGSVVIMSSSLDEYESLQGLLNHNKEFNCHVCAKGGLFMSYIGRVNKMKVGNIENDTHHDSNEMTKLRQIFSERQLALIEFAFEGSLMIDQSLNYDYFNFNEAKVYAFYKAYEQDDKRLKAICQNIIDNKGTFKL